MNYTVSCGIQSLGGYLFIESLAPELPFWNLLHSTEFTILEIGYNRFEIKRTPLATSAHWLIVDPRCVTQEWRYNPIARPTCVTLGQGAFH